jgi:GT2 family glycosyltransferase
MTAAERVSVVMPAYDAAATVGAAVSSVLWQTGVDCELIVVDDGSTDRTPDILAAYDDRIVVVRQANRGVAAARNAGIAAATSDLVAFCDADDILFETHLSELLRVRRESGHSIATANSYWLLPGGIRSGKTRHKGYFPEPDRQRAVILEQNFVSTMSVFPRELVDEIGWFDESMRRAEDWDFWLRAIFAGHRVAHQPKPLALYRWGATGLSADPEAFSEAEAEQLRRVATWPQLTAVERAYVQQRLDSPTPRELSLQADAALRDRRYAEAAALYDRAATLCPSETMLVRKARLMRAAPPLVGRALRARQVRVERSLGMDERRFH